MKRLAPFLLLLTAGGCAYFNGIYNAREAEKRGDKASRSGREAEAATYYATAAVKAETVLARYPRSKWADDALYLAGRGAALSAQCGRAVPRLRAFLELPGQPAARRERATLGLGMCLVREQRFLDARELLAPLVRSSDRRVSNAASLWAARAAIALGDTDEALGYLRSANVSAADWELARAYLAQQRFAQAESLLVRRASDGDFRPELIDMLRELWRAGRTESVERLAALYDRGRTASGGKARVHLTIGDLYLATAQDSQARRHFVATQRFARDSVVGREGAARLMRLAFAELPTLEDVQNVFARARETAGGSELYRRLEESLLLLGILEDQTDFTGSTLFLAGEIARDSLGARLLAHNLFKRVPTEHPRTPVAPKALLAAAAMLPDSAERYYSRIREEYPASPYTRLLDGVAHTEGDGAALVRTDNLLTQVWTLATKRHADSLSKLRATTTAAGASAQRPGPTGTP